jgi:hypothetical protein
LTKNITCNIIYKSAKKGVIDLSVRHPVIEHNEILFTIEDGKPDTRLRQLRFLDDAREALGLTLVEWTDRARVSRNHVYLGLREKFAPSVKLLNRLRQALGPQEVVSDNTRLAAVSTIGRMIGQFRDLKRMVLEQFGETILIIMATNLKERPQPESESVRRFEEILLDEAVESRTYRCARMLSEAMTLADEIGYLAGQFSLKAMLPTLREVGDFWRGIIAAMKAVSDTDSLNAAGVLIVRSPDLISGIFGSMPTVTSSLWAAYILAKILKTIDNRWVARAKFDDLGEAIEARDWALANARWEETKSALETWTDKLVAPDSWASGTFEDSWAPDEGATDDANKQRKKSPHKRKGVKPAAPRR